MSGGVVDIVENFSETHRISMQLDIDRHGYAVEFELDYADPV